MVDPQAGEAWGSTHPPHSLRDERRYKRPRRGGLVRIWFKCLVQRKVPGSQPTERLGCKRSWDIHWTKIRVLAVCPNVQLYTCPCVVQPK